MSSGRDRNEAARVAEEAISGVASEAEGAAGDVGATDASGAGAGADAADVSEGWEAGGGDAPAILPDVAALTAERDEYLNALQRLKADFDNYRKRVARLQEEQTARAAGELVRKILPVLDNLDLAIAHLGGAEVGGAMSEEARALDQARSQLLDVLSKEGLERVDAAEVPFDPTVHDAVAHAAPSGSDGRDAAVREPGRAPAAERTADTGTGGGRGVEAGTGNGNNGATPPSGEPGGASVDEVMRAGYRWRGQVLRPAMVRVRS